MQRIVAVAAFVAATAGIAVSGRQPVAEIASDIARGTNIFADRCASCHGQGAVGGDKAPALAGNRWLRGLPDSEVRNIITNGTPNGMPRFALPSEDLRSVTAWLRSLNNSAFEAQPQGDVASGERFFFGKGKCATCHIAFGRGKPSVPICRTSAGN